MDPKILYRIKKNQVKMMRDRGYKIGKRELPVLDKESGFTEFETIYEENEENLNKIYSEEGLPKAYVHFSIMSDINKNTANDILGLAKEKDCKLLIIIVGTMNMIKPEALTTLGHSFKDIRTTVFTMEKLLVRPIKHSFAPKYRKLNLNEIEKVIKEIPTRKMQLLRVSDIRDYKLGGNQQREKIYSDPAAEYLGLEPGNIVEIKGSNFYLNSIVKEFITYAYVK